MVESVQMDRRDVRPQALLEHVIAVQGAVASLNSRMAKLSDDMEKRINKYKPFRSLRNSAAPIELELPLTQDKLSLDQGNASSVISSDTAANYLDAIKGFLLSDIMKSSIVISKPISDELLALFGNSETKKILSHVTAPSHAITEPANVSTDSNPQELEHTVVDLRKEIAEKEASVQELLERLKAEQLEKLRLQQQLDETKRSLVSRSNNQTQDLSLFSRDETENMYAMIPCELNPSGFNDIVLASFDPETKLVRAFKFARYVDDVTLHREKLDQKVLSLTDDPSQSLDENAQGSNQTSNSEEDPRGMEKVSGTGDELLHPFSSARDIVLSRVPLDMTKGFLPVYFRECMIQDFKRLSLALRDVTFSSEEERRAVIAKKYGFTVPTYWSSTEDQLAVGTKFASVEELESDPFLTEDFTIVPRIAPWCSGDMDWPVYLDVDQSPRDLSPSLALALAKKSSRTRRAIANGYAVEDAETLESKEVHKRQCNLEALAFPLVYKPIVPVELSGNFLSDEEFIAGRYFVHVKLGEGAFGSSYECTDAITDQRVCVKVMSDTYFDQAIQEVHILRYVNRLDPNSEHHIYKMLNFFYYQKHVYIVTELFREDLHEFQKLVHKMRWPAYYTYPRIQRIAKQVLESLQFIHSKGVIHADLKPENILLEDYSTCDVKIIDFGSCYYLDGVEELPEYLQSRSYRAPEIILGMEYDYKIDIWSLGCILFELATQGQVLFENNSVPHILSQIQSVFGPFPLDMLKTGRFVPHFFLPDLSGETYQQETPNSGTV